MINQAVYMVGWVDHVQSGNLYKAFKAFYPMV